MVVYDQLSRMFHFPYLTIPSLPSEETVHPCSHGPAFR